MKEKNINKSGLDEKIKKIKQQWIEEANAIFEADYPRNKNQLDGQRTTELARLQSKYNRIIQELLREYK